MEKTVSEQQAILAQNTLEMDELMRQMTEIKRKYDAKQLEVTTLSKKINDKLKLLNESRKAYNKVKYYLFNYRL